MNDRVEITNAAQALSSQKLGKWQQNSYGKTVEGQQIEPSNIKNNFLIDGSDQQALENNTTNTKHIGDRYPEYSPKALSSIQFVKEICSDFHDQKYNRLTPESGIGTDDGYADFNIVKEIYDDEVNILPREIIDDTEKDDKELEKTVKPWVEDDQTSLTDSSIIDSNVFDSEESYDSRCDPLHFDNNDDVGNWHSPTETDSSDWDSEDDSSCDDSLLPKGSFLMKLKILLTENEENLICEFYQKMEDIEKENNQELKENACNPNVNCTESALERIKHITDEYLNKGIRLNSYCSNSDHTVTSLIFEKIIYVLDSIVRVTGNTRGYGKLNGYSVEDCEYNDEDELLKGNSLEIIKSIISDLLLKGGKVKHSFFYHNRLTHVTYDFDYDLLKQCKKIENKLKDVAYHSIVNKQTQKHDLKVEIDNGYFYAQYPQKSVVKVASIINNQEVKDLSLRYGILQIGKSIVRVENIEEKRNYTDIPEGSIKMSFTTEVEGKKEKISILLYPDKNKVKVKLDEENQKKFNKLKDKSSLGKNCLLGGKNIAQAIEDGSFERNRSMSKESTEQITIQPNNAVKEPDAPSTFVKETSTSNIFDDLRKHVLGG